MVKVSEEEGGDILQQSFLSIRSILFACLFPLKLKDYGSMIRPQVGCVFIGFILFISEVQGQQRSICVLKGSSVNLSCSAENPTSNMTWYTVHKNASTYVLREIPADGDRVRYMSGETNFTLTIKDLRESDAKFYCCRETTDTPELCWDHSTELHVADLQVKVIPATEGQTVTLMCSLSCPLTETPAAYVWYKNREYLYEDWSHWYQQLVSSDEAVRYSCAIKGYEDLRAPEVSVDSVTSNCFSVTYAGGRMCSYKQTADEPCSITYPREIHVERTKEYFVTLTCNTSCPMADPQMTFRWYINKQLHEHCERTELTLLTARFVIVSCSVKGHEDLRSDEACVGDTNCETVNYVSRRICELEGSSVNIESKSSHTGRQSQPKSWKKLTRHKEAESLTEDAGRVEFKDDTRGRNMLIMRNLTKNDSAEYTLKFQEYGRVWKERDLPRVILVVTGLKATFTPSAEVTEGQRVTVTCSTSCPLTDTTNYIWYLNSRPLTSNQNKHLVLDPVSLQHAGNFSCAVRTPQNISSDVVALTVKAVEKSLMTVNALKQAVLFLILFAGILLHLTLRKKKPLTSAAELPNRKVESEQIEPLYDCIPLVVMNPAAQTEAAADQ